MEKLPIEIWDELVYIDLAPATLKVTIEEGNAANVLLDRLRSAKNCIRIYLTRESCACRSIQEMTILVERHQVFFSDLLDTVYSYLTSKESTKALRALYELAASELETIMLFLASYFTTYFNQAIKVPRFMGWSFAKKAKSQLSKLKVPMMGNDEPELVSHIYSIIESVMVPSTDDDVNFYTLSYCKGLLEALSNWRFEGELKGKFPVLVEQLIAFQFNDDRFVKLVLGILQDRVTAISSESELDHFCNEYYKYVSQILETGRQRLLPDKHSAKEVILAWLSEEITYAQLRVPKKENEVASAVKIKTSLSVPILALYVRLFKELGIFTNVNHEELFRAVSLTFSTQRGGDVSVGYLHGQFYTVEESSKRKVFDQLMEMARLCKKLG